MFEKKAILCLSLLLFLKCQLYGEKVLSGSSIILKKDKETGMYTNWEEKKTIEKNIYQIKNIKIERDRFRFSPHEGEEAYIVYKVESPFQ